MSQKQQSTSGLENYEVLQQIGKGSFGIVCKIRRKADNKILVWKELNYGKMSDREKQQLVAEVNIIRELKHPNIVRYYDRIIDKKEAKIYIIMEYCEGGDMGALLKKCKKEKDYIAEDVIWKIFTQIVSALNECHNKKNGKILHRDLKPANIFLDAQNNIKLGDFGLSKLMSDQSVFAYTHVGTPYYMSPEQINEAKYNEKSDIWSAGCLLYEMAALHPPFEATNHLSLAIKIKAGKFERLPMRYSEDLHSLVQLMITVDQQKRPSIEQLLQMPQINLRLKERKLRDRHQAIKQKEGLQKEQEGLLKEMEQKMQDKEKDLDSIQKQIQEMEEQNQQLQEELQRKQKNADISAKIQEQQTKFFQQLSQDNLDKFYSTNHLNSQDSNNGNNTNNIVLSNQNSNNNTQNFYQSIEQNKENFQYSKEFNTPLLYAKNTSGGSLEQQQSSIQNSNSNNHLNSQVSTKDSSIYRNTYRSSTITPDHSTQRLQKIQQQYKNYNISNLTEYNSINNNYNSVNKNSQNGSSSRRTGRERTPSANKYLNNNNIVNSNNSQVNIQQQQMNKNSSYQNSINNSYNGINNNNNSGNRLYSNMVSNQSPGMNRMHSKTSLHNDGDSVKRYKRSVSQQKYVNSGSNNNKINNNNNQNNKSNSQQKYPEQSYLNTSNKVSNFENFSANYMRQKSSERQQQYNNNSGNNSIVNNSLSGISNSSKQQQQQQYYYTNSQSNNNSTQCTILNNKIKSLQNQIKQQSNSQVKSTCQKLKQLKQQQQPLQQQGISNRSSSLLRGKTNAIRQQQY